VTFDGGSIDGFVRGEEVDMMLLPDLSDVRGLSVDADGRRGALILCDIAMPDGEPFEGCPRTTLQARARRCGDVSRRAGALEVEFYLFELDPDGMPTTRPRRGSYFDINASDRGEAPASRS
jgi:glutamine synthetase